MAEYKFKKLSLVESESDFTSDTSQHLIVEDGGGIKRLKAEERLLPKVEQTDDGKVPMVEDGRYVIVDIEASDVDYTSNSSIYATAPTNVDEALKGVENAVNNTIADAVADWLDENITEPTVPVIDASLTVSGAAADAKATRNAIDALKSELTHRKTLSFDYVSGSGHSSSNDRLSVEIEQGDTFYLRSDNSMPYLSVSAIYSDGTSGTVLSSSNSPFETCLVASKKISELGVYFGSPSSSGTFTMYVDYGFHLVFSEIEKRSDEVGTVRTHSISYTSGSAHSSHSNKLFIDIPAGEKYRITINSELTGNVGIYEFYGNNQTESRGNVLGVSDTTFTAVHDTWAIGFYFASQASSGTASITIRTGSEIKLFELDKICSDFFKTPTIKFEADKFYNNQIHTVDIDTNYKLAKINVAPFRGGKIKGQTSIAPNSRYSVAFVDENDGYIIGYSSTHTGYFDYAYELLVPENATYFYVSCRKAGESQWIDPQYPWEYALMNLAVSVPSEMRITNRDVYGKLLNARKTAPNENETLSILHFSDLHGDKSALYRIMNYAKMYGSNIADAICTGDMVPGEAEQIESWWDENVLTCVGNHDTADYEGGSYDWTALSMANRDAYYIAPFESNWGVTHTSGTSYYYKDYTTQKVRLIVMDAMLYVGNTTETEAGTQTTWLEGLLADAITNNLHVLIAIHAPHGGSTAEECSFSKYGQGAMPTLADCNTPQTVIDTVSAKITSGLKFIGYIVGHTHQDNIWDAENDGKQLMYCVTCAAVDTQDSQWANSDQFRDDQHDAFNLITVDTNNTLVKIIRGGGADIDNHMRTRKAICFDYSTGTKVGEVL